MKVRQLNVLLVILVIVSAVALMLQIECSNYHKLYMEQKEITKMAEDRCTDLLIQNEDLLYEVSELQEENYKLRNN